MLATIVSSQQRRGRPHSSDLGGALPALVFAPGVANPLLLAANTSEAAALGGAKAARAGALAASGAYAALEAALGGTDVFSYPVHLWCFSQAVAGLGGAGDPHKQHCFVSVVVVERKEGQRGLEKAWSFVHSCAFESTPSQLGGHKGHTGIRACMRERRWRSSPKEMSASPLLPKRPSLPPTTHAPQHPTPPAGGGATRTAGGPQRDGGRRPRAAAANVPV
jgi:hypothetical protein